MTTAQLQDQIKEDLHNSDSHVVGALMRLFSLQTADEQSAHTTVYNNGVGFNGTDAGIMSDFARQFAVKEWLSEKQIALARKKIMKYTGQLERFGYEPLTIKSRTPQPKDGPMLEANLSKNGDRIHIRFTYDPNMVAAVKQIPGRRYVPEEKTWIVANTPQNTEAVRKLGFPVDWETEEPKRKEPARNVLRTVAERMQCSMFPFQNEGVEFFEQCGGRAICGDEPGLGKTIQAIAWIVAHPEVRPVVIVCPGTAKLNWQRELKLKGGLDSTVLEGTVPVNSGITLDRQGIYIINYDILAQRKETVVLENGKRTKAPVPGTGWLEPLQTIKPMLIVPDECQYMKNRKAARTSAMLQLAKGVPHILPLSGTPITSRPVEFWTALHMVRPDLFRRFMDFAMTYCGARHNGFGWDFNGASNLEALHRDLKSVMIRRKRCDVLPDLPEKIRSVVPVEITNRKAYQKAQDSFLAWLAEHAGGEAVSRAIRAEALTKFSYLKQLAAQGKMDAAIEWIQDYLDSGKKLVVFSAHTAVLDKLANAFGDIHVRVDGSVTNVRRDEAIQRFQTDDTVRLFLGNLQAAGTAITLTAADTTVHLEFAWCPGDHSQAEDRVARIGQESDSVSAVYLVGVGTVDEHIMALLDEKQKVLDTALDGKTPDESDEPLFLELLERYTRKATQ